MLGWLKKILKGFTISGEVDYLRNFKLYGEDDELDSVLEKLLLDGYYIYEDVTFTNIFGDCCVIPLLFVGKAGMFGLDIRFTRGIVSYNILDDKWVILKGSKVSLMHNPLIYDCSATFYLMKILNTVEGMKNTKSKVANIVCTDSTSSIKRLTTTNLAILNIKEVYDFIKDNEKDDRRCLTEEEVYKATDNIELHIEGYDIFKTNKSNMDAQAN